MNNLVKSLTGMNGMTDQAIATDLLISAKSGIKMAALAVTETATPELKAALRQQLNDAIETHEKITNYMISKGYYHPHNLNEQIQVDTNTAQTALNLPGQ